MPANRKPVGTHADKRLRRSTDKETVYLTPPDEPQGNEWDESLDIERVARRFYDSARTSAVTALWDTSEWSTLELLTLAFSACCRRPTAGLMAEVRAMSDALFLSPESRRRAGIGIAEDTDTDDDEQSLAYYRGWSA